MSIQSQKSFENASKVPSGHGAIVNYVWINALSDERLMRIEEARLDDWSLKLLGRRGGIKKDIGLCSVQLSGFDRAFENAKRYPDARFDIWVDYKFLSEQSRLFLQSHFYVSAPQNVSLKDINEIPAYEARRDIFAPEKDKYLWTRTDLARLEVLAHTLENARGGQTAVYADFDIHDVKLGSRKMNTHLSRWGMCFASAGDFAIENSFIALRKGAGEEFLKEKLLPKTYANAPYDDDGYIPLCNALDEQGRAKGFDYRKREVSMALANGSGYQLPKNPLYRDCGINL